VLRFGARTLTKDNNYGKSDKIIRIAAGRPIFIKLRSRRAWDDLPDRRACTPSARNLLADALEQVEKPFDNANLRAIVQRHLVGRG